MEEALQVVTALELSQEEQMRRLDQALTADERELIELYLSVHPNGILNDAERETRDGAGRAGSPATEAILRIIPHV